MSGTYIIMDYQDTVQLKKKLLLIIFCKVNKKTQSMLREIFLSHSLLSLSQSFFLYNRIYCVQLLSGFDFKSILANSYCPLQLKSCDRLKTF